MLRKYFILVCTTLGIYCPGAEASAARRSLSPPPSKSINFYPKQLEELPSEILDQTELNLSRPIRLIDGSWHTMELKLKRHGSISSMERDGSNRREHAVNAHDVYPTLREITHFFPATDFIPLKMIPIDVDVDRYMVMLIIKRVDGHWRPVEAGSLRVGDIFSSLFIIFKKTVRIEEPSIVPPPYYGVKFHNPSDGEKSRKR